MAKLGEFFNHDIKSKFADSNIIPGSVIKFHTTKTNPPKVKRIVILGVDNTTTLVGAVFINSNVNFKIINSQEILELQYPIKEKLNTYLDWDSFVDCSKIIKFDYEYVKTRLIEKPNNILGTVKADDLKVIYQLVKKSPVISKIELKNFGLN